MKIQAIIFDVYQTLLRIGVPLEDPEAGWRQLWLRLLDRPPALPLADFDAACRRHIDAEHGKARQAGISYPEVYWPRIVSAAAPDLARLPAGAFDDFMAGHAALTRSVRLAPGAAELLPVLEGRGVFLGLASNSQPYTLRELETALGAAGLRMDLFAGWLRFFSFEAGFSKPDSHVFRLLTRRLECRGVRPDESLMIGDRWDNDIEPARLQGWRTWHLAEPPVGEPGGGWDALAQFLQGAT